MKNISDSRPIQRPIIITIICLIGFLSLLILIPILFSKSAANVGLWYRPFLALSGFVSFMCMLGLWRMKRWAPITYTLYVIVGQIVSLYHEVASFQSILIPLLISIIMFSYSHRMT